MNKHFIYIIALCCTLFAIVACSKEELTSGTGEGMGQLSMNILATRTGDTTYDPMDHLTVRIFNKEGGLLRKYSSKEAIPESLELLAGEYRVTVEAGERLIEATKGGASFEVRYYQGEQTFTIAAGQSTSVEVLCKCMNTAVEVKFDTSIAKNFTSYHAWIAADESFSDTRIEAGEVAALRYTGNAKGYFDLLESETTLAWKFSGEHNKRGPIEKTGTMTAIRQGGKYILQLNFSPDLPGFIVGFPITVDTSTDDQDDMLIFSPDPVIEGVDFDMKQRQDYLSGEKQFSISTVKPMQSASFTIGTQTIDLMAAIGGSIDGLTVTNPNPTTLLVTLADAFFANRPGGDYILKFNVNDTAGGALTTPTTFRLQGVVTPTSADWDLWTNTLTLRIVQIVPQISSIKFGLRTPSGTWLEADGVQGSDGTYSATFTAAWTESTNTTNTTVYTPTAGTGVFANTDYECRTIIDGATSTATFTPSTDQIIPDGNMENSALPCFSKNGSVSSPFWGSGNAATSGLCNHGTKTGMGGSGCARLKPGVTFGNLAAGNLFSAGFSFGGTSGSVYFGVPYQWTARPRAMKLKYHAKVGEVNYGNFSNYEHIKDGQDCSRIFVALVDWTGRHTVTAGLGSPSGIWDPATQSSTGEGAIIAYGSLFIKQSTPGDSMVESLLELYYYDHQTRPSKDYTLVISCATSAYGDYKVGCSNNELFVDDFEWVY